MSNVKLYIDTDLLDFNDQVNIKRQINDYRNLDIGSNVTSFTLKIPLTRTNRRLLGFINDVRSREQVTGKAYLSLNGIEAIKGKLRILRSTGSDCTAIIEGNDWIGELAGTSIKALSWAGGDAHDFTSANIVASWSAAAGAFYRYPLINFCELISQDYGVGGSDIYPYEFYMAWQVQTIVTKLLLDAGYTLDTSGFLASTFGRALYILAAPVPAEDDFITGKALEVYVDDATDNQDTVNIPASDTGGLSLTQIIDIDAETTDEGSDFNPATNLYTVPADGTYRFQGQVTIWCTFNRSPTDWSIVSESLTLSIRKNGSTVIESVTASGVTIFDAANAVYNVDTGYVHLEAGDTVNFYINTTAVATNISLGALDAYLYIMAGSTTSFLKNVWSEQNLWPGIGKSISPTEYLPDIDSVDLLKALKQAFNLRFFMDRNNKKVYVETANDFYGSTVIDWTDKIDYSTEPEQEVIAANYKKIQRFKWKPDTEDKAYSNEVSANGVPFQKELTLTNEYAQLGTPEENENPVFAPTVTGDMPQIGHWGYKKVPRIFGSAEFVSPSRPYPANRPKTWEPRIMQWKGLTALTSGSFDYFVDIQASSGTNYTTFPSMETPDMSDMYDSYMLKDWNRIDNNKIITCELILKPSEILKFITVVGTAANEGFRATYKLNIEGVDMNFIVASIITDGDRVKAELIQKL